MSIEVFAALASFGSLVVVWLALPSRYGEPVERTERAASLEPSRSTQAA